MVKPWPSNSSVRLQRAVLCLAAVGIVAAPLLASTSAGPRQDGDREAGGPASVSSALEGAVRLVPVAAEFEYIGSKKCRACHLKEYRSWQKTPHAQAFELLKPGERVAAKQAAGLDPSNDYRTDSECLQCHTVGYGEPGGFESLKASRDLVGVGCEACHGPGSEYFADDVMGLKNRNHSFEEVIAKGLIYPVPAEVCQRCHNERSPFNADLDPKYAFEYSREKLEAGTHDHPPLKYDHGPLPAGVIFQKPSSR